MQRVRGDGGCGEGEVAQGVARGGAGEEVEEGGYGDVGGVAEE